jgi:glycosyltransferase involved in cell wall biosynthesis
MNIRCSRVGGLGRRLVRFDREVGIVIPAFNEAAHLPSVLAAVARIAPAVVVVVDDASTDDTAEVMAREVARARAIGLELVSLRNERNSGKQGSVRRGLAVLEGRPLEVVALIDGDGQHDPGELPDLAALLERYDAVIGHRSQREMPYERRLSNFLVNLGFAVLGGVDFYDVQSGLRLYRKPLADLLAARLPNEGGYGLEHESLALLAAHAREAGRTLELAAAPVSCAYGVSKSSLGLAAVLHLTVETFRQASRMRRISTAGPRAVAASRRKAA